MLKTLLWAAMLLLGVTLALLAGIFVGQRLSDADAAGQEARAGALAKELANSRRELDQLRAELLLQASQIAAATASTASSVEVVVAPPVVTPIPVREPAYRRFGNTSCTLSTSGDSIEDGCAELRRISASVPQASGR
ncbi:hypothetical protein [Jeongeupia naejangsanensis]|uniref:DUF2570 domain-containing protein n=1 Tax=Jeongeupia naejangsanensis TaxID=613195 RepID=A0ABS2BKK7_9NEIS|nr:hypothetical protein [Jeongeupia naejangsanensis]MBM3116152.1 hypothetical protein [Jeongeupia naejangsanensis]